MKESFPIPSPEPEKLSPTFEEIDQVWTGGFEEARVIHGRSGKILLGTETGPREENQDTLVLDTEHDAFAVVDGMGGYAHGREAARIVAEELQRGIREGMPQSEIQKAAFLRMKDEGIGEGGACYAGGRINGKTLETWHAGDARVIVVNQKGGIQFSSKELRLENAPTGRRPGMTVVETVDLKNWDRIIAASDGLWDNIDIEKAIKQTKDMPVQKAFQTLRAMAQKGMEEGLDPDHHGNMQYGNKDNLSILLYEILPVPLRGI